MVQTLVWKIIMERTLADYIKRIQSKESFPPAQENKDSNQYLVYPEKQSQDSDEKINPYSQV
jgi:hypothetical protein